MHFNGMRNVKANFHILQFKRPSVSHAIFSGTDLQAKQKSVTKQAEMNLSDHFLNSCVELT